MIKANIAEVKAHFSSYVRRARAGEVVLVCERNIPVAELRSISESKPKKPELGFMKGAIWHSDDAFAPLSPSECEAIENAPIELSREE